MKQVRMKVTEVANTIVQMTNGFTTWDDVLKQYPLFEAKEADAKE